VVLLQNKREYEKENEKEKRKEDRRQKRLRFCDYDKLPEAREVCQYASR
jgi:hypothetical protein